MYHLANDIVTTIGVEESFILVASSAGLFLAVMIRWRIGRFGWLAYAATGLPLLLSLYLIMSCWMVNQETVDLLHATNAITQVQADVFLEGMYNDMASIAITGCLMTAVLWCGLRLWSRHYQPQ